MSAEQYLNIRLKFTVEDHLGPTKDMCSSNLVPAHAHQRGKKDEEEEKQCCVLEAYKIGGRGREEEEETGGQRDGVTLSFSYQHCDRREAKGAQSSESDRHSTVSPKDTRGAPSLAGERGKISVTNQTVHCGGRAGVTPPLSFRFKRGGRGVWR